MFTILLFTVLGFLIGMAYVLKKRKIRPGVILAATFVGLVSAALFKAFRDYFKTGGRKRYF